MKKQYKINALFMICALLSYVLVGAQNVGEFCEDAIPISEGIIAAESGIMGSSASNDCFGSGANGAIWYNYTPTMTGTVTISSSIDPNQADTRLSVYSGTCNTLSCIANDDDGGVGFTSELQLEVEEGVPVYLEWDDKWDNSPFVFIIGEVDSLQTGCMDPEATNYNPDAVINDFSCVYEIQCDDNLLLIHPSGLNAGGSWSSWVLYAEDGYSVGGGFLDQDEMLCVPDGCYSLYMYSQDSLGWEGDSITISLDGVELAIATSESGIQGDVIFGVNTVADCPDIVITIPGCMDPDALNYNPSANVDNGSCQYPFVCEEGVPVELYVCTFGNGEEIDMEIVDSEGNVVFAQSGFENVFIMYQDLCLLEGECYTVNMSNNTGPFGWYGGYYWINYAGAQISTGELGDGQEAESLDFSVDGTCGDLQGCTDPEASNYNPAATVDDGSCSYPFVCDEGVPAELYVCTFGNGQEVGLEIVGDNGEIVYSQDGFEDLEIMYEYICLEEGVCYTATMTNNSGANGWYGGYFWINLNGELITTGELMDGLAVDDLIFSIDGTCGEVFGCTDPEADNYNPDATADDGSCIYLPPNGDCQASFEIFSIDTENDVLYILNTSTFDWGVEYLWDFGDGATSTAPLPIHTYAEDGEYTICLTVTGPDNCEDTYCMDIFYEGPGMANGNGIVRSNSGFTINVQASIISGIDENESVFDDLIVYPNPTEEDVNIGLSLDRASEIQIAMFDYTGSLVKSQLVNTSGGAIQIAIDLSELSTGIYLMELIVDDQRIVKKINLTR